MKFVVPLLLAGGLVLASTDNARAHISLTNPVARTVKTTGQKGPPPCGNLGPKSPQKFRPGETIMVKWDETVPHVGHFRIAFDDDGMDFPAPVLRKDTNTVLPIFLDGLFEKTNGGSAGPHQQAITFPNKPCTNCTLQVIQIMKLAPPYAAGAGSDIYYQCADIVLEGEPVTSGDAGAPVGGGDAGAGGSGGGSDAAAGTGGASGSGGAPSGAGGTPSGAGGASSGAGGAPSGAGGGGTSSGGTSGASGGASGANGGSSGAGSGGASGTGKPGTGGSSATTSAPSSGGGCAVSAHGQSNRGLGALMTLALAALAFLRRRRS